MCVFYLCKVIGKASLYEPHNLLMQKEYKSTALSAHSNEH